MKKDDLVGHDGEVGVPPLGIQQPVTSLDGKFYLDELGRFSGQLLGRPLSLCSECVQLNAMISCESCSQVVVSIS